MKKVKLSDVCIINPHKSEISTLPDKTLVSFLPMANISEEGFIIREDIKRLGEVKKGFTYFKKNDILLAKITPCFENGKRTIATIKNDIGFGTTEFHVLRPDENKIILEYLYYLISSPSFRAQGTVKMVGSAGQKRIPKSFIENFKLSLPELAEQNRIVEILNRIDNIIKMKKSVDFDEEELTHSTFIELFGNPSLNPKGFDEQRLGDISVISMGGTPSTKKLEYWKDGTVNWMKSGDIKGNFIKTIPQKITELGFKNSNAKAYKKGDVVIAMNGQGKTRATSAILDIETTSNQSVASISPKNTLNSIYLHFNLKFRYQELRDLTGDKQRSGLNLTLLRNLKIMCPPIELQEKFASFVLQMRSLQDRQKDSTSEIKKIYNSVIEKAISA